jgi:hypothetical protein
MNIKQTLLAAALLAGLAACGGGTDAGPPAAGNTVPASATASPEAFSSYAGSIKADDQAEPLNLEKVEAPTSETAEPIIVS